MFPILCFVYSCRASSFLLDSGKAAFFFFLFSLGLLFLFLLFSTISPIYFSSSGYSTFVSSPLLWYFSLLNVSNPSLLFMFHVSRSIFRLGRSAATVVMMVLWSVFFFGPELSFFIHYGCHWFPLEMVLYTLQIKISAVSVFLEANHHSIITHIITLDKKTLK